MSDMSGDFGLDAMLTRQGNTWRPEAIRLIRNAILPLLHKHVNISGRNCIDLRQFMSKRAVPYQKTGFLAEGQFQRRASGDPVFCPAGGHGHGIKKSVG